MRQMQMYGAGTVMVAVAVMVLAAWPGMAEAHHYYGNMGVTYYERTSYGDVDLIQMGLVVEVKNTGWYCYDRISGNTLSSCYSGARKIGTSNAHVGHVYLLSPDGPESKSFIQQDPIAIAKEYSALEDLDASCTGPFFWTEERTISADLCYVVPADFEVDSIVFGQLTDDEHDRTAVVPLRDPSDLCNSSVDYRIDACDESARYIVGKERARVLTSVYNDGRLILIWDRAVNLHNTGNVGLITNFAAYESGEPPTSLANAVVDTVDDKSISRITILKLLDSTVINTINSAADMYFVVYPNAALTAKLNDVTGGTKPILVTNTVVVR